MSHRITTYARRKKDSNVVCCGHRDHSGRHTCGIRFGEVTPEGYLMIDRGWEGADRLMLNGYNDGRLKRARTEVWFGEWRAKPRPQDTNHGEPLTPMRSLSHYDNVMIVCPDHGGHEQYLNLVLLGAVDPETVAASREELTFTPLD